MMARARNIKPAIFKNEILGTLDPLITILFQSLWCLADRNGKLEDRPLRIKAETFPYRENIDVNGYLTELQRHGFIDRYIANGIAIIKVVKFHEHQSPHNTEKQSVLPDNDGYAIENIEKIQLTVKQPLNNGKLTDAKRPDSLNLIPDSLIPDTRKTRKKIAVSLPIDFKISDHVKDWAKDKGFENLDEHFENFIGLAKAKAYTYADWDSAFMNAVRNDWAKLRVHEKSQKKQSSHSGFDKLDYRKGVKSDGTFD